MWGSGHSHDQRHSMVTSKYIVKLATGEQIGPVDANELKQLAMTKRMTADAYVQRVGGSGRWTMASEIRGLVFGSPAALEIDDVLSPKLGNGVTRDDLVSPAPARPVSSPPPVDRWWLSTDGNTQGPFSANEIVQKYRAAGSPTGWHILREGDTNWLALEQAPWFRPASAPTPVANSQTSTPFQTASDTITSQLGLAKIEGFSLSNFFSEVFSKHAPDELERQLAVGSPDTTPALNLKMGVMPSPWIFFRIMGSTVILYFVFCFMFDKYKNDRMIPGIIMLGSFAVPFSVLILFFELNTPKNISISRVVRLLFIGAAISLLLTHMLNGPLNFLTTWWGDAAAGPIEEPAKILTLLIALRAVERGSYPYRLNALLLGAAVGTGFAAFETMGYALEIFKRDGVGAMIKNIELRALLSPFMHVAWTAIAASAFWIARPQCRDTWTTLCSAKFLRLFSVPVALHFCWNYSQEYVVPTHPTWLWPIAGVIALVTWVVIISLIQSGLKEMSDIASGRVAPNAV